MLKEKNTDKYLELEKQISKKENHRATLLHEKENLKNQIEIYRDTINEIFLREESYRQMEQSAQKSQVMKKDWSKIQQAIYEISEKQKGQVEENYFVENQHIQNEIENLKQKISDLSQD